MRRNSSSEGVRMFVRACVRCFDKPVSGGMWKATYVLNLEQMARSQSVRRTLTGRHPPTKRDRLRPRFELPATVGTNSARPGPVREIFVDGVYAETRTKSSFRFAIKAARAKKKRRKKKRLLRMRTSGVDNNRSLA